MKMLSPLAILACILSFVACSKHSSSPPPPSFSTGYNVYMAGSADGKAVYWKNGTKVDLGSYGVAEAIALNGTDVYVGGYLNGPAGTQAAYWKNGQLVQLEDTVLYSHVFGMAVNGADVYCVGDILSPLGTGRDSATYWKNGVRMHLSPTVNGKATGVLLAGPEVYITGQTWSPLPNNFDSGMVWKNGVPVWYTSGIVGNIILSQADTVLVGSSGSSPFYSINGVAPLPSRNGYAANAAFSGSDLYICGTLDSSNNSSEPVYWKNGALMVLPCSYSSPSTSSIGFAGSDLYVAGTAWNQGRWISLYWKNGVMNELADSGGITAICVGR